ncbi:MAG: bifunctional riboflavin kinase/FAD synthetase [bacterium]|nr:bifunctional riboflavin kinase/FAD synthetase [bacterium]
MILVPDVLAGREAFPNVALTIGSFDGVHRGHTGILDVVLAKAREIGGSACVLTLTPHPRQFFSPEHAPNLLTPDSKKLALLEAAGIDAALLLRFDEAVAALEPADFVQNVLVERCGVRELVVGHDFRFGRGAKGDYEFLCKAGKEHGFGVTQVPPLLFEGERVSSTLIRERVLEGDLVKAEQFLGRRYSMVGAVQRGRGMGVQLGYPTANIKPEKSVVPPHGVYVAEAVVAGKTYPAAVNIGIAPTIRHEDITIEAFILDFSGDIVDENIEVVFIERLRPEMKFESREELIAQIGRDVAVVRERLA